MKSFKLDDLEVGDIFHMTVDEGAGMWGTLFFRAERRDAMSERERPACVGDDHQCRNVTDGHLVRVERKRSVGWICHYWQSVLRKGGPCMMPIRCAACRREWPGKEKRR
jgi:hypothetical protein